MECVFSRTRKSLEHLKRFIEAFYIDIFEPWFVSGEDSKQTQFTLIKTATQVWQKNPTRCLQVLEKLWQVGILSSDNAVEWSLKSLGVKNSISSKVLKLISERVFGKRQFLLTLFLQRNFIGQLA